MDERAIQKNSPKKRTRNWNRHKPNFIHAKKRSSKRKNSFIAQLNDWWPFLKDSAIFSVAIERNCCCSCLFLFWDIFSLFPFDIRLLLWWPNLWIQSLNSMLRNALIFMFYPRSTQSLIQIYTFFKLLNNLF